MNIDFDKIQKERPKSYEKFINSLSLFEYIENDSISLMKKLTGLNARVIQYENLCYCDLEKFFDDNGIIIEIFQSIDRNWHTSMNGVHKKGNCGKTRDEAKEQAVYKAFEIMEKQNEIK